ncbi:hypothetical protein QBC43DRAFT_255438 [Cladorrhinum sp. PSN259]|nr:hypothetical protein QBC43DRAFT_255438 [Cladorrhinum sp. PSN259]
MQNNKAEARDYAVPVPPNDANRPETVTGQKWNPGFVSRFPFVGFGALTLSVCCTAAAVAIVLLSDGKPTSEWSGNRQPGVLLAYTSTLGNALISIAFGEGVIVSFWAQALQGVRMSNLHYNWSGGSGAMGALTALRHGRGLLISAVCLLAGATTLLRGPLMQRATSVKTDKTFLHGVIQDLQITDNVANDWAGYSAGIDSSSLIFTPGFSKVAREFQARTPMKISGVTPSCDNCSLTVPAFGFETDCAATKQHYLLDHGNSPFFEATVFRSSVSVGGDPDKARWYLNLTVLRKPTTACEGDLEVHTCILTPASVAYDLRLNGAGEVTFQAGSSWRDDTVVKTLDELFTTSFKASSPTLEAVQRVTSSLYASTSIMRFQGAKAWYINNTGLLANTYVTDPVMGTSGCAFAAFEDPLDEILNGFREIALRMGIGAAGSLPPSSSSSSQKVAYTSELVRVVYVAKRGNLALAVAISLVGPLATLVLFWGWWKLGRSFSLSPLEVANAFCFKQGDHTAATLLAGSGSNASGGQLAEYVRRSGRDPVVRYGVVDEHEEKRLAVAVDESGTVRMPRTEEML